MNDQNSNSGQKIVGINKYEMSDVDKPVGV